MAIWLIRAGKYGEYEQRFLEEGRVYVTWDSLNSDLSQLADRKALNTLLTDLYKDAGPKEKTISNWVSQIWPFRGEIKKGDLVIVPLKSQPVIYVGEVTGDYTFNPDGPNPFYHYRAVNWVGEAIPRHHFGKDLLFSFGAFLTICRIKRNNAEARITAMKANGWKPETISVVTTATATATEDTATEDTADNIDLEELARDQIAQVVSARFKGHGLARLVEGILKAQGYTTYRSPEGPDGGIDILAGTGPMGFGSPRLCVQVKSQDSPVEAAKITELKGAMQNVNATEGLFVSWSGFKSSIYKQIATNFFSVRLWTQKEFLEALFTHYDQLDEELKAELPLKRVWMVAAQDEE